ncbi:MAG: nucleoside kinase [Bacteroidales bacterium]|nr:nucleoside kinase [Bacteroidales bacterium]
MIKIKCENNQIAKTYKFGTRLHEIIKDQKIKLDYPILGALVNNKLKELSYRIFKPKTIKFIDITHPDGMRMYVRSLSFILIKATKELFPNVILTIEHSVSKGYFCEIKGLDKELSIEMVFKISNRMKKIIKKNIPFKREEILTEDAIKLFEKNKFYEKVKLLKSRKSLYTSIYYLGDQIDYFYGYLVPSTGYLKVFDIVKYYNGMLLMVPKRSDPVELEELILQDKMFEIFREYKQWGKILNVESIGDINEVVQKGNVGEILKIAEALHEKKVVQIADKIYDKKDKIKVVLISGPSSSGKTSFTKRLAVQLKVAGLKPVQISLDNYFVDREHTPRDEKGEYDFEVLEALDIKLFNNNLLDLFNGKEIKLPKFSFETGKKYYNHETLKINSEHIILVEGIHALNPELTPRIAPEIKFEIYVSALTQLGIDSHNRIPTTDNRLIRRLIRDYRYRGYSGIDTLKRWQSVRIGEEKNIFPYQEEADVMFNSALLFELGVLKKYAVPILSEIQENYSEYAEAQRLLKFLSYILPVPEDEIPPTSILREFLGGSSFKYD